MAENRTHLTASGPPTFSVFVQICVLPARSGALQVVPSDGAALTTMSKVSLTEALPSLAVTFTETVPTSAACGVPEKVRVLALKLSHEGNAVPSACVAV